MFPEEKEKSFSMSRNTECINCLHLDFRFRNSCVLRSLCLNQTMGYEKYICFLFEQSSHWWRKTAGYSLGVCSEQRKSWNFKRTLSIFWVNAPIKLKIKATSKEKHLNTQAVTGKSSRGVGWSAHFSASSPCDLDPYRLHETSWITKQPQILQSVSEACL